MGTNGSKTAKRECLSRDVTDKSKAKEEVAIERLEQDTALRLNALQQTFNHLEESLRVMSTYKTQHGHLFADSFHIPQEDCSPCNVTDAAVGRLELSAALGRHAAQETVNHVDDSTRLKKTQHSRLLARNEIPQSPVERDCSPRDVTVAAVGRVERSTALGRHAAQGTVDHVKDSLWLTSSNKSQDGRLLAKSPTPVERDCLPCDDTEAAMERLELSTLLGRHALQQTVNHLEDSLRVMFKYKTHHSHLLAEIENLKASIKLHLDYLPHDITESSKAKALQTFNDLEDSFRSVSSRNAQSDETSTEKECLPEDVKESSKGKETPASDWLEHPLHLHAPPQTASQSNNSRRSPSSHNHLSRQDNLKTSIQKECLPEDVKESSKAMETPTSGWLEHPLHLHALPQTAKQSDNSRRFVLSPSSRNHLSSQENRKTSIQKECLPEDVKESSKAKETPTSGWLEHPLHLHALPQTANQSDNSRRFVLSPSSRNHLSSQENLKTSIQKECLPEDVKESSKAKETPSSGWLEHPLHLHALPQTAKQSDNSRRFVLSPSSRNHLSSQENLKTSIQKEFIADDLTRGGDLKGEAAIERLQPGAPHPLDALQQTTNHVEDQCRDQCFEPQPRPLSQNRKFGMSKKGFAAGDLTRGGDLKSEAAIERLQPGAPHPLDALQQTTNHVEDQCRDQWFGPQLRPLLQNRKFGMSKKGLSPGDFAEAGQVSGEAAIERLEHSAALRLHSLQQTVHHLEDSLQIMSAYTIQHRLLLAKSENFKTSIKSECQLLNITEVDKTKKDQYPDNEQLKPGAALRLQALQRSVSHLEDSLQVMSTYKSQHSLLLAKNENLKTSIENKTVQFQSALNRLSAENEELRTRLHALESTGSEREAALWRRLQAAEEENARLTAERDKCEKCLDQVAHGVVQALLSQKGLGEEITTLREKVKELEKQNYALSSLLLHNVPKGRPSIHALDAVIRPLSCDDGRLRWSQKDESLLWTPAHRPSSLNLDAQPSLLATLNGECHKDEGYSTMSSEVQGEGAPSQGGPLERLQEESGRLGEDVADDLKLPRVPRRSSSDSALLPLCRSPSRVPPIPLALLTCDDGTDWWEPALCEPEDDAVPPPPELEEWNMDDIPGLSFLDLEEDVWSAVDSWSSGRTTASSSLGASHVANGGFHSKRSSGADSAATGISAITPGDGDGVGATSFTRDFYRLVKFESNKSLASTSSKSQSECGGKEPLQNVLQFISQQPCAEEPKESDSEPTSLLEKTACISTQTNLDALSGNSNSSGISSDEQLVVKPSESWGLLTVPEEEPEADGEKRKDSTQLEESPLRAANTLAELERIVSANEEEDEDFDRKEKDVEEKPNVREWRPTGWVHLHRAEFNDPKARANYADLVMLASRSSSSCSGSSESGDDHSAYQQLHRLHRSRRHKKASATRDGAVRIHMTPRVSIVGREDIFTRFGAKEAEAVASFDFLEQLEA